MTINDRNPLENPETARGPEPYIYADNAATTPLSARALEAMTPYLTTIFGNPSGIHRVSSEAARALASARARMARALGARAPEEIYFTSCGSESDNWVLRGAVQRYRDLYDAAKKPRIITSAIEHHAVLHCCDALVHDEEAEVTLLPVDDEGRVSPEDLEAALAENERLAAESSAREPARRDAEKPAASFANSHHASEATPGHPGVEAATNRPATDAAANHPATALVSIMLANNEVGTIQDIKALAQIAHAHGVPFHTDAVQAVGHIPVDVEELEVDALSLSGHKFHGPRGVGALYLREGFSIPPLIAGGAQERGERAGTENVAGIIGMVTALEDELEGLAQRMARIAALRDRLADRIISTVPDVKLTGDPSSDPARRLPSIASFACKDVDGELLIVLLDRAGIAAATGSACATGSTDPSHVITALGITDPRWNHGTLRLSLSDTITEQEEALLEERVPACIKRARMLSASAEL